jgi:hypothetical protein
MPLVLAAPSQSKHRRWPPVIPAALSFPGRSSAHGHIDDREVSCDANKTKWEELFLAQQLRRVITSRSDQCSQGPQTAAGLLARSGISDSGKVQPHVTSSRVLVTLGLLELSGL